MTVTNKLIPFYVWFLMGFGIVSILMGIINFGMNIVTMFTVKGIFMPLWAIPIAMIILTATCIAIGWFFETYTIQTRISSHTNRNLNSEFNQMIGDIKAIKKALDIPEEQ
jgi:hypothetical protein